MLLVASWAYVVRRWAVAVIHVSSSGRDYVSEFRRASLPAFLLREPFFQRLIFPPQIDDFVFRIDDRLPQFSNAFLQPESGAFLDEVGDLLREFYRV